VVSLPAGRAGASEKWTHLGKDTTTAADVEDLPTLQPPCAVELFDPQELVAEEVDAGRVHAVQEAELARRVPPVGGEGREVVDLGLRDRVGAARGVWRGRGRAGRELLMSRGGEGGQGRGGRWACARSWESCYCGATALACNPDCRSEHGEVVVSERSPRQRLSSFVPPPLSLDSRGRPPGHSMRSNARQAHGSGLAGSAAAGEQVRPRPPRPLLPAPLLGPPSHAPAPQDASTTRR